MAFTFLMNYHLGWSQSTTKHLLVQIVQKDAENVYNSSFHRANMQIAKYPQSKSFCFVEDENAFLLTVEGTLTTSELQKELGGAYVVKEIKSKNYQTLLRHQAAKRLSLKSGVMANESSFPKLINSGNAKLDQVRYRKAIETWLEKNPQKFQQIIQARN